MKLQDIGFYTLTDERVQNVAKDGIWSPLTRCELILSNACNFHCPYCRGLAENIRATMSYARAEFIVQMWASHGLKNIRFSGGEPTLWPDIVKLVAFAKSKGVKRIAISSNGSAELSMYDALIAAGVNDFSISLDACCAAFGDKMAGDISGAWEKVIRCIKHIAPKVYTTVGVVVTDETIKTLPSTIEFADSLGVSDIRIISAAQWNVLLQNAATISPELAKKYPILNYRLKNIQNDINVRGIKEHDVRKCGLVLDDMAIAGKYHFPCIIYMREGGQPIGEIDFNNDPYVEMCEIRTAREKWMKENDTFKHRICAKNCLDVCQDYNRRFEFFKNSADASPSPSKC